MMRLLAVAVLLVCLTAMATAQSIFEQAGAQTASNSGALEWHGYSRGMAWLGGERFDYASLFGEFALQGKLGNNKTFLTADVRFREGYFLDDRKTVIELKEAYAGYRGTDVDFYLGKQIVTWGRTDGFNPTNNLNPNDYFLLTTEPDDQKMGNFMARLKLHPLINSELELVVIPLFMPSVYRYDLFEMGEGVSFSDARLPLRSIENAALAARFNVETPGVGFSVSYFNGFDPFYGYTLQSFNLTPAPEVVFRPEFYRKQSIGADFAIPVKWLIVRGEAAYDLPEQEEGYMHIPNSNLSYVAAMEVNFAGITLIGQYIGKYTFGFTPLVAPVLTDPYNPMALYQYAYETTVYEATVYNRKIMNQQEQTNHALFLSVSRAFAYDKLTLRASGYYNITSEEYLIRPEMKWTLTDAVSLSVVGNWMKGPEESIFDNAGKILGGFGLGLTVHF